MMANFHIVGMSAMQCRCRVEQLCRICSVYLKGSCSRFVVNASYSFCLRCCTLALHTWVLVWLVTCNVSMCIKASSIFPIWAAIFLYFTTTMLLIVWCLATVAHVPYDTIYQSFQVVNISVIIICQFFKGASYQLDGKFSHR